MAKVKTEKLFAVIGLGRFGTSVAKTLFRMGYEVLAIDSSEERINEIADFVTHAVQADAKDEEVLKKLGIRNFDTVIVAIGSDVQANILVTVILKDMGVRHVVAKAQNDLHGKVLTKVGADRVVYPERDMGVRVAHALVTSTVMDYLELSPVHSLVEIRCPDRFVGQTIGAADLRARYGITVIAVRKGDEVLASPGADTMIEKGDILVAVGSNDDLNRFEGDAV
ncbi:NAD(P)-binding domain-containing protein [Heliobacterium gestii]|uniref:NAD(P)-binding domain-containing protein n=1 Tax=Heliomicrobium gestii TaxID=2699 RepID=A0A845LHX9_HELGE|nr:TrkA family potassium uptake protein [Heliomicrobium gestii]MBM7866208.1 trk system potassium uptake protein TrkA [Heliomicrobium gestii]MZP42466.1 NAD(P)-binding domain-containing protein [Heliomicrobium gestii]